MTFEIGDYTDAELYDVLDLTNPTDRELEAKILMQIHKYNSFENESSKKLVKFFEDVYEHFFNVDEEIAREPDTEIVTAQVPTPNDGVDDTFLSEAQLSSLRSKNSPFAKTEQQITQPEQESSIGYTRPLEYSKGILNPLLKQTTTRVISIDSQYRPNKNTTASDFTFNLSEPLRDVVSLKLYSVQIPNTWYTIGELFGSNFFIFKGRADGITDDAFDIKFEIDPGNYTPEELASTVNASIDYIYNNELVIPDISGSRIEYNSNTSLNKMNVKVKDIYNESSYQLSFPYWTSPIPFGKTGDKTRNESIPEFLGFIERTYKFNTIKSRYDWRFEESESNFYNNELFSITELNKSFEVIKYSGTTEYEHNVSTVDLSFGVALTASSTLLNRLAITNLLYYALQLNDKLFSGDSTISLDPIDSGNDTIASASLYNMTVKLDRKTYNHASDSKLAIKFPEEDLYNVEYALNTEYDSVVDISQNIYGTLSTTTEILQSGSTKAYRIIMTSSQSLRELRVNSKEETAIIKDIYDSSNNLLTSIGNIGNIIASRQLNVNPSIDTHFTLFLKNTSDSNVSISLNGLTYVDYANNTNVGNSLIFQNNTSSTDVDDISFIIEPNNFLSAFMIRKHNSDNQSTDKIHYRITNETGLVISGDISNADVSSSIINFDTTLLGNKTSILSGKYTLELSGNAANEIEYEIEIKQKDFAPDVFDISNILEILVAETVFDDNIIVFSLNAGDRLKNITIIKQDSTNSETIEYRLTSDDTETVHIDGSTTDVNTIITPQPVIKPTDNTQYLLRLSTGSSAQVIHTVIIEKIPDYDIIGEYITFVDDELTVINTIYNSDQDIISFDVSVGEYVPSLEVSDFSYNGDVDVSMEYVLFSVINDEDISFASGYIDINNKTLPIAEDLSAGSYKLDLSSSNVVNSYPIDYKLSAVKRTIQDISLGISTIYERTGTINAYNFDLYSLSVDVSDIIIEQTSENEIYWRLTDNSMIDLSGNSESSDTSFNILENETLTNTLPYKLYISVSGDVVEDVSYTVRALNTEIVLSNEPLYPIDHHTRVYDTITRDSVSLSAYRTLYLSINPYTYVEQFILKELVSHTDYETNNTTLTTKLTITTNNGTSDAVSTIIDIVDTYGGNSSIYSGIINTSEKVIKNTLIQTEIQGYSSIDYYYDIVTKDIEPIFYDASNNLNVSGDLSAYTTRVVSFDLSADDVIRSLNTSPTTNISFSLYPANGQAITPLRPTIDTTYYLQITNNAGTVTSYDVSGIRLQDYTGTTTDISVTDISFANDIVTIENEITQVDFIDRIRFVVPEKSYVYELNTIDISNIDTADVSLNYRLTNSVESIDISGIITVDGQSLLSDNLFLPSGTYTLQLEAPPSMINSTYYKLEGSQRSIQDTSFINDELTISVTINPSIYEIILGNGYSLTGLSSAYSIIKGTDIRATPISVSDLSAGTYQLIVNTNTTIMVTRIFDYADLQDISFSNNLITFEKQK